jgi:mRNA-degrading endonuclease RelE of RelBE toxin-antitoxin system
LDGPPTTLGVYELVWDEAAKAEIAALSAFMRRIIVAAVDDQLRHEPDVETRNRKPLREPVDELPEVSWELRVRDHRVLYWLPDRQTVTVLRVILKGTESLTDATRRGGER